jgi:uncharacterized protein (UPF0335 family)
MELRNDVPDGNAQDKLRSYTRRVLSLMEDRDGINADIAEVVKEAKADGFDAKILRKVVARKRQDEEKLREEDALVDLYEHAVQGDLFADGTKVEIQFGGQPPIETRDR